MTPERWLGLAAEFPERLPELAPHLAQLQLPQQVGQLFQGLEPAQRRSRRVARSSARAGASLAVFALREGCRLPLHDHPHMHVLTRVVSGALRIERFDDLGPLDGGRAVRPLGIWELRSHEAPLLTTPTAGAIHAVEALEDTLFLDVLAPDYGPGRHCTEWQPAGELRPDVLKLVPRR